MDLMGYSADIILGEERQRKKIAGRLVSSSTVLKAGSCIGKLRQSVVCQRQEVLHWERNLYDVGRGGPRTDLKSCHSWNSWIKSRRSKRKGRKRRTTFATDVITSSVSGSFQAGLYSGRPSWSPPLQGQIKGMGWCVYGEIRTISADLPRFQFGEWNPDSRWGSPA